MVSSGVMPGRKAADGLIRFYFGGGTAELCAPIEVPPLDGSRVLREVCEAALEADPLNLRALFVLGDDYTRSGEYERGLRMDLRLVTLRPRDPVVRYNLACSYSLIGFSELAFFVLEQAIELGFDDVEHMWKDPDLENIRSDARFGKLMRRAETGRTALA